MVFLQLDGLLKSNQSVDAHFGSRRIGGTGEKRNRNFTLLRRGSFGKGSTLIQSKAEQISHDLLHFAAFVHRAEFYLTHQIVGQIDRCFHTPSLLVY